MNPRTREGLDLSTDLLERWRRFVASAGSPSVSDQAVDAAFHDLARRYGDPRRAYHNVDHLRHCFRELDGARRHPAYASRDLRAIELALWFHDAVYRSFWSNNEAKSADLMETVAPGLGFSPEVVAATRRMIEGTKAHASTDDPDEQLMFDCDLSILGQEEPVFARFQQGVRKEYQWVPGFLYARRRRTFLESLLARPAIFQSVPLHAAYESSARRNIEAAVRGPDAKDRGPRSVSFDDSRVWTHRGDATLDQVRWDALQRVVIITTDTGPFTDDVFWLLDGGDGGLVAGSEDAGANELRDRLMKLPDFDFKAMAQAMGCSENAEFVVWRR